MNNIKKLNVSKCMLASSVRIWKYTAGKISLMLVIFVIAMNPCLLKEARATPLIIPGGIDQFETIGGGDTFFGPIILPTGFFGTVGGIPSDPFSDTIFFVGNPAAVSPVVPMPTFRGQGCHIHSRGGQHCQMAGPVPRPDTQVMRPEVIINTIGGTAIVDVQMVVLELLSEQPIEVTYGGVNLNFFDVFVSLDPLSNQLPAGTMTLTRTGLNTGQFIVENLTVDTIFQFQNQDPAGPQAVGSVQVPGQLTTIEPWEFTVIPEPTPLALLSLGLTVVGLTRWRMNQ